MRGAVAFVVLFLAPAAFAAPTKDECVDADTRAQTLRMHGKLKDARAQLAICTSESCPSPVKQDCTERLDELNRVAPSLVFDVKDSSGHDVVDAKVTMDGQPLLDRIVPDAVAVDPGDHEFVFTARGHLPNTMHVLVHEGDKDRRVQVTIGVAGAPDTSETPEGSETPAKENEATTAPGNGQRIAAVVVGALGLVGIGIGTGFGAAASSAWNASQTECNSISCPNQTQRDLAVSDHNTAFDFATVSTVAFIAGGVLGATGIVLFFLAPHGTRDSSGFRAAPLVGPGIAGLTLTGAFR